MRRFAPVPVLSAAVVIFSVLGCESERDRPPAERDAGMTGMADTGVTSDAAPVEDAGTECVPSGAEVCDAERVDEDCDGAVNEGCVCVRGETRPCGSPLGECTIGSQRCGSDDRWGACEGDVRPTSETCNGLDD